MDKTSLLIRRSYELFSLHAFVLDWTPFNEVTPWSLPIWKLGAVGGLGLGDIVLDSFGSVRQNLGRAAGIDLKKVFEKSWSEPK